MIVTLLADSPVLEEVIPHTMFHIGSYAVTNAHILTLIGAVVTFFIFYWLAGKMQSRGPRGEDHITRGRFAQMLEVMVVFCREEIARRAMGDLTDKYINYVWTTFFFILVCNLIGLLPIGPVLKLITGSTTLGNFNGAPTASINMTGALALVSFFMMNFVGLRHRGWAYFKSFRPVPFRPWPMIPMAAFMVVIEVISMFIKTLALCIRLFANMIAGHMVIAALLSIIFIVGVAHATLAYAVAAPSVLISLLLALVDVFVAFLQAYIFAFLTVVFISLGLGYGDEDEQEGHEHESARESAKSKEPEFPEGQLAATA